MSVSFETIKEIFVGDGGTTTYDTSQAAYVSKDDVIVYDVDPTVDPATYVLLVPGVDYTASLLTPTDLPSLLHLDLSAAYPTGFTLNHELHVIRASSILQSSSFVTGDRFPATAVELALDKVILGAQDAKYAASKSLHLADQDDHSVSTELPLLDARKSLYLGFNASGEPVALDAPAGTTTLSAWGAALVVLADSPAALAYLNLTRFDSGAQTGRGLASAYGAGFYYSTDTKQLSYSNGSIWVEAASIGQFTQATLPGATFLAGRLALDTNNLILKRDSGSALVDLRSPLPRTFCQGFRLARNGSDTHDLDVDPGEARDSSNVQNLIHTTLRTKQLDTAGGWVTGNNQAGRPAADALGANKWHHVFVIGKADGTVDIGFDDQVDASQLLDAGEAGGDGYLYYRRIGSVKETAAGTGVIELFSHDGEDEFLWSVPVQDLNAGATSATAALLACSVPPDVKVGHLGEWDLLTVADITANAVLITSPDQTDTPTTVSGVATIHAQSNLGNFHNSVVKRTRTNTARQVRYVSQNAVGAHTIYCTTQGWMDPRGRNL